MKTENMKRFTSLNYPYGMKVHFYPNYTQKAVIKRNSDILRYYYNRQLGIDYYLSDMYDQYGVLNLYYNPLFIPWFQEVISWRKTSVAKKQHKWLKDKRIDCFTPSFGYRNEHRAKKNYHNGLQKHARFHTKRKQGYVWKYQTATYSYKRKDKRIWSVYIIDRKHIYIKGLGKVRTSKIPTRVWQMFKEHHLRLGTVTIMKDNCDVFSLSFQLASDHPFVKLGKRSSKLAELGYDLNTSNYLMDSNGNVVSNPRYYERKESKLKWVKHQLSRKYRHDKNKVLSKLTNYQDNRRKIAKVSKHVYNQRSNFLQNLSTKLIETHDFLAGESLESSNMLRNHRIAKSIQSVGWRSFINMLAYKTDMYHKIYILVNPAYTTQMCDNCGYICNKKDDTHLTPKDRTWTCPKCGMFHIRDVNAAKNIIYSSILAIQRYLPKSLRFSIHKDTKHKYKPYNKKDMKLLRRISISANNSNSVPAWLKYLVTHYCGVLDSAKPNIANLNTFHRI